MGKNSPKNPPWFSFTTAIGQGLFYPPGGVQSALTSMDTAKCDNLRSKSSLFQQKDHKGFKYSKIKAFFLIPIRCCLPSKEPCVYVGR